MVIEQDDMPSSRHKSRASSTRSSRKSSSNSSKVTRDNFSPRSLRLAEAGRTGVRVAIATGNQGAFPHEHKEFTWRIVQRLAKTPSAEAEWSEILEEALNDLSRKLNLTGYVCILFSRSPSTHAYVNLVMDGCIANERRVEEEGHSDSMCTLRNSRKFQGGNHELGGMVVGEGTFQVWGSEYQGALFTLLPDSSNYIQL